MRVEVLTRTDCNPDKIVKEINEHLSSGWELHGELKVQYGGVAPNGRNMQIYTQAVKKS